MNTWEKPSCPLCGNAPGDLLAEARDYNAATTDQVFRLVLCRRCRLAMIDPQPTREAVGGFYPESYAAHREISGSEGHILTRKSKRFGPVEELPPGRYLDIGCGSGYDLLRMRDRGWTVAGFEPSRQAAKAGLSAGLDIRTGGDLADARFEESSFDLVTMFCVLPHVHDPLGVLREVARLLSPGGTLLLTVPNLWSLNFRLFGGRWYHLDPPRHLWFFSDASLREMAARTGFRVRGKRFRSGGGGFKGSLRHAAAASPAAERIRRALRTGPGRWLVRSGIRFLVDPARMGDTVDYWWRRNLGGPQR